MKIFVLLAISLCLYSCAQLEPRYPLNKKQTPFLNSSAQKNKKLLLQEQKQLVASAESDSLLEFQKSEAGFLYAYITKAEANTPLPVKGEEVLFQYQIEDLKQNLLYAKEELGTVTYAVDEEELLPALRVALRMMKSEEVVVFLFPSYLCYSYQGDGDKIGINQPLRFTIERLIHP